MDNKYFKVFGLRGSGGIEFTIRCNITMKELSYEFKRYSDNELIQIAINLTNKDIEKIKRYIKFEDFEMYREKKNENSIPLSYLDGWAMEFEGIIGSEIPILKLSSWNYESNMQPPVEKLYSFLMNKYFYRDKKYKSNYGK